MGMLRRVGTVTLSVAAVACSDAIAPAEVMPFDATVQPTLTVTSSVTGAAGEEIVRLSVAVGNPDAAMRRYTLRQPCVLLLRLYATPARTGTPLYADERAPGGCKWSPMPDTLAGHGSVTLTSASHPALYFASPGAPPIQPFPAGRYYASVSVGVLELSPGTSELPAGEVQLATP
jgi:hypothetical protein